MKSKRVWIGAIAAAAAVIGGTTLPIGGDVSFFQYFLLAPGQIDAEVRRRLGGEPMMADSIMGDGLIRHTEYRSGPFGTYLIIVFDDHRLTSKKLLMPNPYLNSRLRERRREADKAAHHYS